MTTYYMRADGSAANKAAATSDAAASTSLDIAGHNAETFSADDILIVSDAGGVYRDTLLPPSSGSSGQPITYLAGGTPEISGADVETSFTEDDMTINLDVDFQVRSLVYFEEESGNRNDEVAGAGDLVDNATVLFSTDSQEGTNSADFEADNSEYFQRNGHPANYPGRSFPDFTPIEFTFALWVKFETLTGIQFIYQLGGEYAIVKPADNKIEFRTTSGTTIASNSAVEAATWYHIVVRWQGTTDDELSMWINGVKQTDSHTTISSWNPEIAFAFWGSSTGASAFFDGLMDEFMVLDRALTDTQITDVHSNGVASTSFNVDRWYFSPAAEPDQVFRDSIRFKKQAVEANLRPGDWWWDSGNSRVYISLDPAGTTIEYGVRNNAALIDTSFLDIDGITFEKCEEINIIMPTGGISNINILNCNIHRGYLYGLRGVSTSGNIDTVSVDNCVVDFNGGSGIGIHERSTNWTVKNNSVNFNCQLDETAGGVNHDFAAGIKSNHATVTGLIIENNIVTFSQDTPGLLASGMGIWLDIDVSGAIIRYNNCNNHGSGGIRLEFGCNNVKVYYNLVYDNVDVGITVFANSRITDGAEISNNVSYGNDIGIAIHGSTGFSNGVINNIVKNNISINNTTLELSAKFGGENDGTEGSGNVYFNNCFGVEATNFILWGDTSFHSTYDSWEAAYEASSSVEADPLFTNAASNDFTLQSGSPVIDAGVDVSLTRDFAGTFVPQGSLPDIGAYEGAVDVLGIVSPITSTLTKSITKLLSN